VLIFDHKGAAAKSTRSILKMLGPFATASRRYMLLDVASRTPAIVIAQAACDVHDDNDNAWQRGPLWPHGMGPIRPECWLQCSS